MQRVNFFGVDYLWMVDQRGKLYLGQIKRIEHNVVVDPLLTLDDQGQKKDYSDDEGTHHWLNCSAVQPRDASTIYQLRRTTVGDFDQLWRRSYLAGSF